MTKGKLKYAAIAVAMVTFGASTVKAVEQMGLGFTAPQVSSESGVHNAGLGDIIYDYGTGQFKGYDQTGAWQVLGTGAGTATPAGAILAYAGSTAPTGYLLCDGTSYLRSTYPDLAGALNCFDTSDPCPYGKADNSHFNVPNAQGVFLRGAGSQTISGIGYSATLGATQGDQFQGHVHWAGERPLTDGGAVDVQNGTGAISFKRSGGSALPAQDGTNLTPRTGPETRPANISVNYIIKY